MNILFNAMQLELLVSSKEERYYRLLLVLGALNPLKVNILMILSHLSPKRLTATQLTELLGYSKNSRVIYRGVLDELSADDFIILERVSAKKFSIQLNLSHPLMTVLNELSFEYGETYTENLQNIMEGYYE